MYLGAKFAKSLAGLTTLAAMFTETVAIDIPRREMIAITIRKAEDWISGESKPFGGVGEVIYESMNTGSHS